MIAQHVPLADVFIVFGLNDPLLRKSSLSPLRPTVLDVYPDTIPLPHHTNLEMMCFPEGYHVEEINETNITMKLQVNHFTIADASGGHKFATALSFPEVLNEQSENLEDSLDLVTFSVPKAFCIISSTPVFDLQKDFLMSLYDAYKKQTEVTLEFLVSMLFHTVPCYAIEANKDLLVSYDSGKLMRYCAPRKELRLPNYAFELLIKKVPVANIVRLVCALLLERKVAIVFQNYQQNAVIMQSLLSLLEPFKWNFLEVSYLAPGLMRYLDAPFPFFFGISSSVWYNACKQSPFLPDILVYDVDSKKFVNDVELPPFPEPAATVLVDTVTSLISSKEKFTSVPNTSVEKIAEYYWAYATLKVKQQFLNFLLLTVNNFIEFYDKHQIAKGEKSARRIFDFEAYVDQAKEQQKPFIKEFVATQAFVNFIESSYNESSYFTRSIKCVLGKSYSALLKKQTREITHALDEFLNPKVLSLNTCLNNYQIMVRNIASSEKVLDKHKIVKENLINPVVLMPRPSISIFGRKSPAYFVCPRSNPFTSAGEKRCSDPSRSKRAVKVSFVEPPYNSNKSGKMNRSFASAEGSNSPIHLRSNLDSNRSNSALTATDKQLAFTISQLQKISHVSTASNRTTTDSNEAGRRSTIMTRKNCRAQTRVRRNTKNSEQIFEISKEQIWFRSPLHVNGRGRGERLKTNAKTATKPKPPLNKRQIHPPLRVIVKDTTSTAIERSHRLVQSCSLTISKSRCGSGLVHKLSSKVLKNPGDNDVEPMLT